MSHLSFVTWFFFGLIIGYMVRRSYAMWYVKSSFWVCTTKKNIFECRTGETQKPPYRSTVGSGAGTHGWRYYSVSLVHHDKIYQKSLQSWLVQIKLEQGLCWLHCEEFHACWYVRKWHSVLSCQKSSPSISRRKYFLGDYDCRLSFCAMDIEWLHKCLSL